MPSILVALLAAPPLTDFNPASHGVWFGALALALVVVLIVAVDVLDWVWQRLKGRRGEPGAAGHDPGGFQAHPPESEVRHRHYREPPKIRRDHRPNEPTEHAR